MDDYKELITRLRKAGKWVDCENGGQETYLLSVADCGEIADAIEQLVKERDAAVKCLPQRCTLCKHYTAEDGACYDERKCADWACHPNWEWRGVQNEID